MDERTMHAVGFRRYGSAEVLEPLEVALPSPGPDDLLVRVVASGVNPADGLLRSGKLRLVARVRLPFVPGCDVAGIVEEVGPAVTGFRPGQAVYAMLPSIGGGGYAEYAVVRAQDAAVLPGTLTFAEAAVVPLAALTALQALRDHAHVQPGSSLLVNGASGGVGTFAVQVGKALGARVTAATSEGNADLVRDLGADQVVDYATDLFAAGHHDAVLDAVGAHPLRRWRAVLEPHGVVVTLNPARGNPAARALARLTGTQRLASLLVQPSGADLATLTGWIEAGRLRPVLEQAHPLDDAAAAHRRSETKRVRGKLALVVDPGLAGLTAADVGTDVGTDVHFDRG